MSTDEALGYCGLYCPGCGAFQATTRGAGIEYEPGLFTTCRGCNSSEVSIWCRDCEIRTCARERGLRFAFGAALFQPVDALVVGAGMSAAVLAFARGARY